MIDWSVKFGDLLSLGSLLGVIGVFVFRGGRLYSALDSMQSEIAGLKKVAENIGAILTTVAVQKNEIEHIRNDIEDLKHGRGLIRE